MNFVLEIDRYIALADISANIWVSPIYRYWSKRPILSVSIGVDKTLWYSSRIQTTCASKHNEASQDRYLTTTLAGAVSQTAEKKHHREVSQCLKPPRAGAVYE